MPVTIDGEIYYRTAEVYRRVGISRNTLFNWLRDGVLGQTQRRDRRGWRLFTQNEVDKLKNETNRVTTIGRLGVKHD